VTTATHRAAAEANVEWRDQVALGQDEEIASIDDLAQMRRNQPAPSCRLRPVSV